MIPREILKKIRQSELRTNAVSFSRRFRSAGTILCLLVLCSCATNPHPVTVVPAKELPADVTLNKEAGRGGLLYVMLRFDDSEELPFLVDTGATGTLLDKSLEPKLGKRLGTGASMGWGSKEKANSYVAPKIYLGNTPLVTGGRIWVSEGSNSASNLPHPAGILGMDCLKHYCIQLDFKAGKMRFLNPDQVKTAELGKAYPLTFKENIPFIHHVGLLGGSDTNLLIDLGCRTDGLAGKNAINGLAQFLPDCVWEGETYSNLVVAAVGHANVLGLNFFARHLVTLDLPKRMMYLKQTSIGPLASDSSIKASNDETEAPVKFLEDLKENGQLSGLSKNDETAIYLEAYSNFDSQPADSKSVTYLRAYFNSHHKSATFGFWKKDDSSICHYTVARSSENSSWKLQKAWRTDQNDKTIEEFPVP